VLQGTSLRRSCVLARRLLASGDARPTKSRLDPGRGFDRLLLPDHPLHLDIAGLAEFLFAEGCGTGQQLIEQDTQRIDIRAGVDVQIAQLGLLRTHVGGGADQVGIAGKERLFRQLLVGGFGNAEVNHLGERFTIMARNHDIGRFDIPMDDAFGVGVLHGLADLEEQV
jgi:hypothetical protein